MDFLLALTPIIVLLVFILVFRKSVIFSATATLLTALAISLYRGVEAVTISAAALRGAFVATEIILIIFGALVMLYAVRSRGLLDQIKILFTNLTNDYRVHVLLVSFGIIYFFEGVAGFGTPAIVAVPLFIALGFKPLWAVALALVADTIPVSFGAIGLPISFGIGSVIEPLTNNATEITNSVAVIVAIINIVLSTLLAYVLVAIAVRQRGGSIHHFTEFIPFATLSALAVSLPAVGAALLFGPELPSVIGGLFGVVIISLLAHHRIGLPKDAADQHITTKELRAEDRRIARADRKLLKSLSPYGLLVTLLVITRIPYIPIGEWLRSISIGTPSLLDSTVPYTIAPFYSAAFILLICAVFTLAISFRHVHPKVVILDALKSISRPYAALLLVLMFVQIFIYSAPLGGDSMPVIIAQTISGISGNFWPLIAPFIGALGAFISGSATVSNVIFSGLQYDIAASSGLHIASMLSLQTIGASLGNMIALHNIIAALTIAGVSEHYSHHIVRNNLPPLAILVSTVGVIGLIIGLFTL